MELPIKRTKDVDMPTYSNAHAAGLDLRLAEATIIEPQEKALLPTGLHMAIPEGHVGLIWDRSGLAAKHGLHCLAGVVDADYRGEVKVVVINLGKEPIELAKNERIAQMVIQPVLQCDPVEVETLEDTDRGSGGFGSSGRY